jgi:hypothetical protein
MQALNRVRKPRNTSIRTASKPLRFESGTCGFYVTTERYRYTNLIDSLYFLLVFSSSPSSPFSVYLQL